MKCAEGLVYKASLVHCTCTPRAGAVNFGHIHEKRGAAQEVKRWCATGNRLQRRWSSPTQTSQQASPNEGYMHTCNQLERKSCHDA